MRDGGTFLRLSRCVADVYQVPLTGLVGRAQYARLAQPRQVLMLLARELLGWTYPQIGARLDRDHTTIITGCRRALRRLDAHPAERDLVRAVIHRFSSLQQQVSS